MRRSWPIQAVLIGALAYCPAAHAGALEEQEREVESMPAEEQAELARQQARFAALAPAEQDQLRKLHADLSDDPRQEELRRVMRDYHEWLKTLEPSQREELRRLPPPERLARVKELRQEQAQRMLKWLASADVEAVSAWFEELVRAKATPDQIQRWDQMAPEVRRGAMASEFWRKSQPGRQRLRITAQEINTLRERLTPSARQPLDAREALDSRQRLVGSWLVQAFFARSPWAGKPPPPLGRQELQSFFESGLTQEEQRELLLLPEVERQRQLRLRHQQAQERERAWRELESWLESEKPAVTPRP